MPLAEKVTALDTPTDCRDLRPCDTEFTMPSVIVGLEFRQTRLISREGWRVQPDRGRGWLSVRLSVISTGAYRAGILRGSFILN